VVPKSIPTAGAVPEAAITLWGKKKKKRKEESMYVCKKKEEEENLSF
jgi:hypothetical protein